MLNKLNETLANQGGAKNDRKTDPAPAGWMASWDKPRQAMANFHWNGQGKVYYTSTDSSELSEKDLWIRIVE